MGTKLTPQQTRRRLGNGVLLEVVGWGAVILTYALPLNTAGILAATTIGALGIIAGIVVMVYTATRWGIERVVDPTKHKWVPPKAGH